jgi:DNA-binding CsgD family transcriptional regulator
LQSTLPKVPKTRGPARQLVDPISMVETAYDVADDEDAWLSGIRASMSALVPEAQLRASIAFVYRAKNADSMLVERFSAHGVDGARAAQALTQDAAKDPQYVRDSLLSRPCDFVSAVPGTEQQEGWKGVRAALGIVDGLAVNGFDSSGLGVLSLLLVTKRPALSVSLRSTLSRVAAHLVAGLRLRRRLARAEDRLNDSDAVLLANGEVTHATGSARLKESRESLRRAARALDRARGRMRRDDSDRAVLDWKVLVEHRWSLVDHFDRDGKRYLLACRNSPAVLASALLTPRERQVVLLAARGHSNKLIAYELGISTSTVGVLLGRARVRLGVTSRRALIAAYFR